MRGRGITRGAEAFPFSPPATRGALITASSTASTTASTTTALPSLAEQAERLIALGIHDLAGLDADALRAAADLLGVDVPEAVAADGAGRVDKQRPDALLAIDPGLVPASALAPLMRLGEKGTGEKEGFVVEDMTDVDDFAPVGLELPGSPVYLVTGIDRGDEFENDSPAEALEALTACERTPLLLTEGLYWVLQQPAVLERNHCFMTIGSRKRKPGRTLKDGSEKPGPLDSRTPALWISNGTGRDGAARKDAPKLGWCWWNNRHTWLGIASAADRVG